MQAEIIAVGSELLTPDRVDTNSLFLTARLNRLGIEVIRKSVVGDSRERLREAVRESLERADVVVLSGGLGPTEDDVTREAVAELLGRRLVLNSDILQTIRERFVRRGRKMPEKNERQAMVPEGATPLLNSRGTAPGLWLETGEKVLVMLPGPPVELEPMFKSEVEALLGRRSGGVRLVSRELGVTGLPESEVDQRIAPIYVQYEDVLTTILASPGEIQVHLRMWTKDAASAKAVLNELTERIVLGLGEAVFTTSGEKLEEVVAQLLTMNGATISAAESCTGGLVAERLTSLSGSSAYFLGGVVCYSNELKAAWVDVPKEMMDAKGAVSAEVARALAEGVRRRSGATLGLSVTGIAGPTGGTAEKPVGTVHIGLANSECVRERSFHFPGDREMIRRQASQAALDMVRRHFQYAVPTKG